MRNKTKINVGLYKSEKPSLVYRKLMYRKLSTQHCRANRIRQLRMRFHILSPQQHIRRHNTHTHTLVMRDRIVMSTSNSVIPITVARRTNTTSPCRSVDRPRRLLRGGFVARELFASASRYLNSELTQISNEAFVQLVFHRGKTSRVLDRDIQRSIDTAIGGG